VESQAWLLWGVIFGSIADGIVISGKKPGAPVPLAVGIALMVFPYFVTSTVLLVAVGVGLIAVPYFVRI